MKTINTPDVTEQLKTPLAVRCSELVSLRWFVKTRWYKNWDDRDKIWVEMEYTDAPVLQYYDGRDWKELPTHRVTVAG